MITTTRAQRKFVREAAGAHRSMPVVVVPGDRAPRIVGESYYWTWTPNPNGTRVRSSRARGMWRTYYHASTLAVRVGATWLAHAGDLPPGRAAAYDTSEAA